MIASLPTLPPLLVYLALFGLVAGESAGVPLPGETSLIAASAVAAHRGSSIEIVIAVAAIAAIVGDNVGFLFGRRGGRWLLTRDGRWAEHRRRYLERGERFFADHGPKAVFLARWILGLRVVAAWLAGAHHMRWRSFLVWNALGGIAWAVSVGVTAYVIGSAAAGLFRTFGYVGLGVAATAGIALGALQLRRRRRRAATARAARAPAGPRSRAT